MKTIYILTLHDVRTGGPEACHQLSDALVEQGFDARMVYYDMRQIGNIVSIPHKDRPNQGGLSFGLRENTIADYAGYKTKPAAEAPDEPNAIIVLPESIAHLAAFYTRATVLVWWLSVDNAFGALAHVSDEARGLYGGINLNLLRRPNVKHASQSLYASGVIDALQFANVGPLSDYTVDMSNLARPLPTTERPGLVAFATGWKVTADVDALIEQVRTIDPEIECVKIQGMSRPQVAALFARARVYVDLGCFPGKDRAPREAVSMGCAPMVSQSGGGVEVSGWWHTSAQQVVDFVVSPHECRDAFLAQRERDDFFGEVSTVFRGL